ncbi:MAG: hypothetical protein FJW39_21090 [Acidobacteria bacterium]|nr:hypothetical protein [Acidobacteriota bacterium]
MGYLAKDLSPEQRIAIESLLGRPISEQEAISVRAYDPNPPVSDQRRREIIEGLKAHFAEVDAHRPASTADEAEEAFEEAMRQSRLG